MKQRMILFHLMVAAALGGTAQPTRTVALHAGKLDLVLDYAHKAAITKLSVNGREVIDNPEGVCSTLEVDGVKYSSAHTRATPVLKKTPTGVTLDGIEYGDDRLRIRERWVFAVSGTGVRWTIKRTLSRPVVAEQQDAPLFQFDAMDTWEGAYQGYGGVAWFYLFNQPSCTYGVHTATTRFWDSKSGDGLMVDVAAPGRAVAMRYTRTADNRLAYGIMVSDASALPRLDSGTHRRRFIRGSERVWAPVHMHGDEVTLDMTYFDVNDRYGRGKFVGIDGAQVSAVLATIARMGVIDSLHFGGNSWHTPYGPICLHEQYIAQLGLAIDDTDYLKGYKSCLDFYRDHAIQPDGRVYPRWAYSDEDMMPGKGNKEGFYEAQWGYLLDSQPDLVANVVDEYNLTGDKAWVRTHQRSCERALDWILRRDSNGNGLVEVMTDSEAQKRGSDWIDIVWASFENAFVNAKLYHALTGWASIERQLGDTDHAGQYARAAATLKAAFNKPIADGGFWDEENGCFVHWLDKDGSAHGRNMVTPVNFMAIAYGLCDDRGRQKRILDGIENGMAKERLFFWPLTMTSYAPGEANGWQYPFPQYENGDIFLSWGSVALAAYAAYDPALAVRYVRNVLAQYSKDGLAFQRYGRVHQEGEGDDILSGNSLIIVGLYQSIYGIHPLYNRLYLEPHLTPDLSGTSLTYRYRGQKLTIDLDTGRYAIGDGAFQIASGQPFGYSRQKGTLSFFEGRSDTADLVIHATDPVSLTVARWDSRVREWWLTGGEWMLAARNGGQRKDDARLTVQGLTPGGRYALTVDGRHPPGNGRKQIVRADSHGLLPILFRAQARFLLEQL